MEFLLRSEATCPSQRLYLLAAKTWHCNAVVYGLRQVLLHIIPFSIAIQPQRLKHASPPVSLLTTHANCKPASWRSSRKPCEWHPCC